MPKPFGSMIVVEMHVLLLAAPETPATPRAPNLCKEILAPPLLTPGREKHRKGALPIYRSQGSVFRQR